MKGLESVKGVERRRSVGRVLVFVQGEGGILEVQGLKGIHRIKRRPS